MKNLKEDYASICLSQVDYCDNESLLEGLLVFDEKKYDKRPGILVVHEWTGIGDFVKDRALELAKMGFVAFCVDVYGKGIRPSSSDDAMKVSSVYRNDRNLLRQRMLAALDEIKKCDIVDSSKIAVIGFCFGGMAALELGRAGADIKGVVSFHGSLDATTIGNTKGIKAKVLVLHGAEDPLVPQKDVLDFQKEMRMACVDWQINIYGGAYHSFMNPFSGDNKSIGIAYNKKIAERAWQQMKLFFDEIFKE